jgi:hypothetical protein
MEAICSPKTSADFQQTTWRYTPEDGTVHVLLLSVLLTVIQLLLHYKRVKLFHIGGVEGHPDLCLK